MCRWSRELWGFGLLLCVYGCGNASSETPRATAPDTGAQAQEALSNNSSIPIRLGAPSLSRPPRQSSSSQSPRATAPSRVDPSARTSTSTPSADEAAWSQWYETARDSPDVSVRLQALETWAQRPGDSLDPVTYGLVDQDETVRNRAQALYEQTLAREANEPVQSSQPGAQESAVEP